MLKREKVYLSTLVVAAAIGLSAQPGTAVAETFVPRLLTSDEAKGLFSSFKAVKEGRDPTAEVQLYGFVPNECVSNFSFENTNTDPNLQRKGYVGFKITDITGQGSLCIKLHEEQNGSCSGTTCTSLSTLSGTRLKLSGLESDVAVGLYSDKTDPAEFVAFDPAISHLSRKTLEAKAAEEARRRAKEEEQEREDMIAGLKKQAANCRGDEDELLLAESALETLLDLEAITESEFERHSKDLEKSRLKVLEQQIARAGVEDLAFIQDELEDFALDHPDLVEQVAVTFYKAALRYIALGKAGSLAQTDELDTSTPSTGVEAYDLAAEAIRRAQSLEGLSATSLFRLANYQREIKVGRGAALAQNGFQNNPAFVHYWWNTQAELQREALRACQGRHASTETCASSMSALGSVAQLLQQARAVDQQRIAMQMQLQQMLAKAMNPQGLNQGNTFPQFPGQTPGFAGSLPGTTSPFMPTLAPTTGPLAMPLSGSFQAPATLPALQMAGPSSYLNPFSHTGPIGMSSLGTAYGRVM